MVNSKMNHRIQSFQIQFSDTKGELKQPVDRYGETYYDYLKSPAVLFY